MLKNLGSLGDGIKKSSLIQFGLIKRIN